MCLAQAEQYCLLSLPIQPPSPAYAEEDEMCVVCRCEGLAITWVQNAQNKWFSEGFVSLTSPVDPMTFTVKTTFTSIPVSSVLTLCFFCLLQAVLMRSSQPLTGQSGRRCKEDEKLINCVLGKGRRGYIVDTRAQTVAKMAQSKGERGHYWHPHRSSQRKNCCWLQWIKLVTHKHRLHRLNECELSEDFDIEEWPYWSSDYCFLEGCCIRQCALVSHAVFCFCILSCVCVCLFCLFFCFWYNSIVLLRYLPWESWSLSTGKASCSSHATQPTVHARLISVSIIHQFLTWTTWVLANTCDLSVCLCTYRGPWFIVLSKGLLLDIESAQSFDSREKCLQSMGKA